MPKLEKGLWIALEGGDGSGKTTVHEKLAVRLTFDGYQVTPTREPGGNDYSEKMRELIFAKSIENDPRSQLLGFVLARRRNIIQTVLPALAEGKIVLSDRSEGSSFAYQVFEYGLDFDKVYATNNFATEGIKPDLTILLDVDIDIGTERVKKAKNLETSNYFDHDQREALEKRRAGYLELARHYQKYHLNPWVIVDANQNLESVYQEAYQQIKLFLNPSKHKSVNTPAGNFKINV